jgi:hypothetical protein
MRRLLAKFASRYQVSHEALIPSVFLWRQR